MKTLSDIKTNLSAYKINYVLAFFFLPIAIWPLYYGKYINFTQMGIILSVGFFIQTVLELPSGALADTIGRKWTIVLAWISKIAYVLMLINANGFGTILLAEIFDKTGEALYSGSGVALIYDSLKENKKEDLFEKVEASSYFWATISFVFASLIGGFLFEINIRLPYIVLLVAWSLALLNALRFQEPQLDSEKASLKQYIKQNIDGFKHIFRNAEITLTSVYSIFISFVFLTGLWWLYQTSANEMDLQPRYVGILISLMYICRAIGTNTYTKVKEFFTSKNIYFASVLSILQAIASFMLIIPINILAIVGLGFRYLTDGLKQPYLTNLQNKQIESKYRATALSAIALIVSILLTLANPLLGRGIDAYGARTMIFLTGFIPLLITFPVSLLLKRREKVRCNDKL